MTRLPPGLQGALEALADLLGSGQRDVQVRALLGVGMLLGGNEELQRQFVALPCAVGALVALMRQRDDAHCTQLAAEVFGELAGSAAVRGQLGSALRAIA